MTRVLDTQGREKLRPRTTPGTLLGSAEGGAAGFVGEITLGAGLSMSGNVLSATGGGGVDDGDKGDITVSSSGAVWTIDNGVVTFAKMQAVSANVLLGNDATGTTVEEIACTAAGRSMIAAADASAQTALLSAFVGDSGSGGVKGLVPAPSAGDAAAGKFLKADGTWVVVSASLQEAFQRSWFGV